MALTAKTQYACLAMIHLASDQETPEPTPLRHIADRHGIPPTFLVQILNQLKLQGLITSTRGASGGYRLNGRAGEITLADVVDAIEPLERSPACAAENSPLAPAMAAVCQRMNQARQECLEQVTLGELAAQAAAHGELMWHI